MFFGGSPDFSRSDELVFTLLNTKSILTTVSASPALIQVITELPSSPRSDFGSKSLSIIPEFGRFDF